MNKDNKWISKLYESIYKVDYFSLEEKDFDLDKFLREQNSFFDLSSPFPELSCILENFEKIKSESKTEDVYTITLHNQLKFKLKINYIQDVKDFINTKKSTADFKKDNDLKDRYEFLSDKIKDKDTICMIMFEDEQGNTKLTGNAGISAKELFVALRNALLDSFSQRNMNNIKGIGMRVSKKEEKRLKFYKMLIDHFLSNKFPNIFVDRTTEEKQGLYLLFATV
jgi:hypothetical protein